MRRFSFHRLFFARSSSPRVQFFRYLFVGASSAVVDLATYAALTELLGVNYYLAALGGYTLGFAWNHFVSVQWIFQSKHSRKKEVTLAYGIAIGGLLWTEVLLYLFVDIWNIQHILAKMLTQVIVLLWNFGMRKKFVFA